MPLRKLLDALEKIAVSENQWYNNSTWGSGHSQFTVDLVNPSINVLRNCAYYVLQNVLIVGQGHVVIREAG